LKRMRLRRKWTRTPLPKSMVDSLDDFYRFLMEHRGYKPHEIDKMDIHHLFKLIKKEQDKDNKKPSEQREYFIDEVDGW
jgi:hypothetical protein